MSAPFYKAGTFHGTPAVGAAGPGSYLLDDEGLYTPVLLFQFPSGARMDAAAELAKDLAFLLNEARARRYRIVPDAEQLPRRIR